MLLCVCVEFLKYRRDINDTTIDPRRQTRTVVVQYETKNGAKTCKRLVTVRASPHGLVSQLRGVEGDSAGGDARHSARAEEADDPERAERPDLFAAHRGEDTEHVHSRQRGRQEWFKGGKLMCSVHV